MLVLSHILMGAGALWCVVAAVGVLRFADPLSRTHAASKATTLGTMAVLAGAAIQLAGPDAAKLMLAVALVVLTAPLSGHLLGRAVETHPGTAVLRIDTRAHLDDDESADR